MSNYIGLVNITVGKKLEENILSRTHYFTFLKHENVREKNFYLHRFYPPKDLLYQRNSVENIHIFIFGELYHEMGVKNRSDLFEIIYELYINNSLRKLNHFNGSYIIIIFDTKQNKLVIANDMIGIDPLYHWHHDNELIFGTKIAPILLYEAFKKDIDLCAVNDYLQLGYIIGNKTMFKHVKRLDPGNVLIHTQEGSLNVYNNHNLNFSNDMWHLSADDIADKIFLLLTDSYKMRIADKKTILVPLSGGLDSRVNVAYLNKLRRNQFDAVTYGMPYHADFQVAKQICNKLNINQIRIPLKRDYVAKYHDLHLSLIEGMTDFLTAQIFPVIEHAQGNYDAIITGTLGNTTADGNHVFNKYHISSLEDSFENYFRLQATINEVELRKLYSANVSKEIIDSTKMTSKANYFENNDYEYIYQKLIYIDYIQRQRSFIFTHNIAFNMVSNAINPFFDKNYVKFMLSIAPVALHNQAALRHFLSSHFKQLASMINSNDHRPILLDHTGIINLIKFLGIMQPTLKIMNKYNSLFEGATMGMATKMWDTVNYPDYTTTLQYIDEMLADSNFDLLGNFLNYQYIENCCNEFKNSKGGENRVLIRRLIGIHWFLKRFIVNSSL